MSSDITTAIEALEAAGDILDDLEHYAGVVDKINAALAALERVGRWRPISEAPKNGTWILLRGRNSVGQRMVPVVAAWCPPGGSGTGWRDSGSFKPVDDLAADPGADFMPLQLRESGDEGATAIATLKKGS